MIRRATWKFSTDEYMQLHDIGILPEGARVELLDGEIVPMSPIGSRHAAMVARLDDLLREKLGKKYLYYVQNPLRLSDRSMPEPDLMVLEKRNYSQRLPIPTQVFLLIEVGDTSTADDRENKIPLYAVEQIPEVWLVDLNLERVEQFSKPLGNTYLDLSVLQLGETIRSANLPELSIEVADIFNEEVEY